MARQKAVWSKSMIGEAAGLGLPQMEARAPISGAGAGAAAALDGTAGRRGRRTIEPINRLVGMQLRTRRLELGLTQSDLAQRLGLTFQQVMKYERGVNRLSAPMLWELAQILAVPVSFFFAGLQRTGEASAPDAVEAAEPMLASLRGMGREDRQLVAALIQAIARRRAAPEAE
jgi:transcriptional regulator with XRE-family HTH domain